MLSIDGNCDLKMNDMKNLVSCVDQVRWGEESDAAGSR